MKESNKTADVDAHESINDILVTLNCSYYSD